MKILVLGASGKTGREVVVQALIAGHEVTAFVRDPNKLDRDDVAMAVGDARNADDLRSALRDQDAVISTLGSGLNGSKPLIEDSTRALLEAMQTTRVKRLVMLSTFAASPNFKATGIMKLARFVMKGIVADKAAGERLLTRSDLDWTIVYATRLTDASASGSFRIVEGPLTDIGSISRADVASALLSALGVPDSVHHGIVVTSNERGTAAPLLGRRRDEGVQRLPGIVP
jgi:uncharacterized protein YbjT (DUF2867 family)